MTTTKTPTKEDIKAPASEKNEAEKATQETAAKATHAIDQVFEKLKVHFEPKKVDEWQKKWLSLPANRKKYEKLADAPEVVGEELVAMTDDIIDFIQGQEGGQSHIFKKLKASFEHFFKHPVESLQKKAGEVKDKAVEVKEKTSEEAKSGTEKTAKKVAKAAKK